MDFRGFGKRGRPAAAAMSGTPHRARAGVSETHPHPRVGRQAANLSLKRQKTSPHYAAKIRKIPVSSSECSSGVPPSGKQKLGHAGHRVCRFPPPPQRQQCARRLIGATLRCKPTRSSHPIGHPSHHGPTKRRCLVGERGDAAKLRRNANNKRPGSGRMKRRRLSAAADFLGCDTGWAGVHGELPVPTHYSSCVPTRARPFLGG